MYCVDYGWIGKEVKYVGELYFWMLMDFDFCCLKVGVGIIIESLLCLKFLMCIWIFIGKIEVGFCEVCFELIVDVVGFFMFWWLWLLGLLWESVICGGKSLVELGRCCVIGSVFLICFLCVEVWLWWLYIEGFVGVLSLVVCVWVGRWGLFLNY